MYYVFIRLVHVLSENVSLTSRPRGTTANGGKRRPLPSGFKQVRVDKGATGGHDAITRLICACVNKQRRGIAWLYV